MSSYLRSIQYSLPVRAGAELRASAAGPQAATISPWVRMAAAQGGLPIGQIGASPKENALHLLRAAAEVEHAFVVQYLYMWFSIRGLPSDQVPINWEESIKTIAIQEMAHLLSVQNLLTCLAAPPHFDLTTEPLESPLSPFPFALTRFNLESVGKFLVAESPLDAQLPPELQSTKAPWKDPKASGVRHVGLIYAVLYWLFLESDDTSAGPWVNFPGELREMLIESKIGHLAVSDFDAPESIAGRIARDEFPSGSALDFRILPEFPGGNPSSFNARQGALQAIEFIDRQGEGGNDTPDNHYHRLQTIYSELKAAGTDPARPVVTNPTLGSPTSSQTMLTDPAARAWARLFNLRYQLLMLQLAQATALNRAVAPGNNALRGQLARRTVRGEMRLLTSVALAVIDCVPAENNPLRAGPPFSLTEPVLPEDESQRWDAFRAILDDIEQAVRTIEENHWEKPVVSFAYMRGSDAQLRNLVPPPTG